MLGTDTWAPHRHSEVDSLERAQEAAADPRTGRLIHSEVSKEQRCWEEWLGTKAYSPMWEESQAQNPLPQADGTCSGTAGLSSGSSTSRAIWEQMHHGACLHHLCFLPGLLWLSAEVWKGLANLHNPRTYLVHELRSNHPFPLPSQLCGIRGLKCPYLCSTISSPQRLGSPDNHFIS